MVIDKEIMETIEKECGLKVHEVEIFVETDFYGDRAICLGSAFCSCGTRKEFVYEMAPFEKNDQVIKIFDNYNDASLYFVDEVTGHKWLKAE